MLFKREKSRCNLSDLRSTAKRLNYTMRANKNTLSIHFNSKLTYLDQSVIILDDLDEEDGKNYSFIEGKWKCLKSSLSLFSNEFQVRLLEIAVGNLVEIGGWTRDNIKSFNHSLIVIKTWHTLIQNLKVQQSKKTIQEFILCSEWRTQKFAYHTTRMQLKIYVTKDRMCAQSFGYQVLENM